MGYNLYAKVHVLEQGRENVTSKFGPRQYYMNGVLVNDNHGGLDVIDWATGTDWIVPYTKGKVTGTRNTIPGFDKTNSAGNYVKLKHGGGYETEYFHLKQNTLQVAVGDMVEKTTRLAFMGTTGWSTGNHLHFGVRLNGVLQDPEPYLLGTKTIPPYGEEGTTMDGVGYPVGRDATHPQIEITKANVYGRSEPGTKATALGFVNPGIYYTDNAAPVEKDGYTWYNIQSGVWVAYGTGWAVLYPLESKPEPTPDPEPGDDVAALQAKNEALRAMLKTTRDLLESTSKATASGALAIDEALKATE